MSGFFAIFKQLMRYWRTQLFELFGISSRSQITKWGRGTAGIPDEIELRWESEREIQWHNCGGGRKGHGFYKCDGRSIHLFKKDVDCRCCWACKLFDHFIKYFEWFSFWMDRTWKVNNQSTLDSVLMLLSFSQHLMQIDGEKLNNAPISKLMV